MKIAIKMFVAAAAVASMGLGPMQAMAAMDAPTQPAPKAASSSAATVTTKKVMKFVGNSETKKFHKPSCEWAKKMNKENKVEFASTADAKKAGYEPCKVCLPEKTAKKAASAATSAAAKTEAAPAAKTQ